MGGPSAATLLGVGLGNLWSCTSFILSAAISLSSRGQAGPKSPIALNVLGSVFRELLGQVGGWYARAMCLPRPYTDWHSATNLGPLRRGRLCGAPRRRLLTVSASQAVRSARRVGMVTAFGVGDDKTVALRRPATCLAALRTTNGQQNRSL